MYMHAMELLEVAVAGLTVATVALAPFLAGLPYLVVESRWRWRWREIATGQVPAFVDQAGVYRDGGAVPRYRQRAPALVRTAAFSSLAFGLAFVPLFILSLTLLFGGSVGLLLTPWLVLAGKRYLTGLALLRRDPGESYESALTTARFSLWLNGTVLCLLLGCLLGGASQWLVPLSLLACLCVLSMLQSLLLWYAATVHRDELLRPSAATEFGGRLYPCN